MTHQINYTAESDGVAYSDYKTIEEAVKGWCDGSPDRVFQGIAYDAVNDGLRISVRVDGVTDIDGMLSTMDSGISSVNTGNDTSFPAPSQSASIQPE